MRKKKEVKPCPKREMQSKEKCRFNYDGVCVNEFSDHAGKLCDIGCKRYCEGFSERSENSDGNG